MASLFFGEGGGNGIFDGEAHKSLSYINRWFRKGVVVNKKAGGGQVCLDEGGICRSEGNKQTWVGQVGGGRLCCICPCPMVEG